jgi:hypothetical protein
MIDPRFHTSVTGANMGDSVVDHTCSALQGAVLTILHVWGKDRAAEADSEVCLLCNKQAEFTHTIKQSVSI